MYLYGAWFNGRPELSTLRRAAPDYVDAAIRTTRLRRSVWLLGLATVIITLCVTQPPTVMSISVGVILVALLTVSVMHIVDVRSSELPLRKQRWVRKRKNHLMVYAGNSYIYTATLGLLSEEDRQRLAAMPTAKQAIDQLFFADVQWGARAFDAKYKDIFGGFRLVGEESDLDRHRDRESIIQRFATIIVAAGCDAQPYLQEVTTVVVKELGDQRQRLLERQDALAEQLEQVRHTTGVVTGQLSLLKQHTT